MKSNGFKYMYNKIRIEIPSQEQRYMDRIQTYIDAKLYMKDLKKYCGVEDAEVLRISINKNERISVSYRKDDECGGFTTFLVLMKDCDNDEN